jgi:serine/threonine protein kinase/uncharacterized protein YktA (UPF0223 family)
MIKNLTHMILEGLVYLHEKRVVFCDLHGGNLVFNEFNMLKYADFGNAKFQENIQEVDKQHIKKEIWAPELLKGEDGDIEDAGDKQDKVRYKNRSKNKESGLSLKGKKKQKGCVPGYHTDLWALGCLLFQMATGKPPFMSPKLREKILNNEVPHVDTVSNELNDLIKKLLNKNPNKRIFWAELLEHPWVLSFDHKVTRGNISQIKQENVCVGDAKNENQMTLKKKNNSRQRRMDTEEEIETASESEANDSDDSMLKNTGKLSTNMDKESAIDIIASQIMEDTPNETAKSKLFKPEDLKRYTKDLDQDNPSFKPKDKRKMANKVKNNMKDSIALDDKIFNQRVEIILQHLRGLLLVTKKDKIIEQIIFNQRIEKIDLPKIQESLVENYPINLTQSAQDAEKIIRFLNQMEELIKSKTIKQQKLLSILTYLTRLNNFKEVANQLTEHSIFSTLIMVLKVEKSRRVKSAICTLIGNSLKNKVSLNPDFFNQAHFVILKDTFLNSNCPTVQSRALASLGEYLFFCSTQDMSDQKLESFEHQWKKWALLEKIEKGVDLFKNLKDNNGKLNLSESTIEESVLNSHVQVKKLNENMNNFEFPFPAIELFLNQLSKSIRKPGPNQLYVLKALQNIITLSRSTARKLSTQRKLFKVLRDYVIFGNRHSSSRLWATYCMLNLLYSVLQKKVEVGGIQDIASLHRKEGVYNILYLLENNNDSSFTQTEMLIKSLISDFKDRDEQVRLASMTLLLFIFSNIPKEFFTNLEEHDLSQLIKDLANLFEHAGVRVKTKCLGIITVFVMRDFKSLYYLLDYPKLLTCFDRDLDRIEIKTGRGFEKSHFSGNHNKISTS